MYCAYITCIFRYTTENMSCFMLERNQQLNLPYRVIRILKFLKALCFFLVCCFSASCNIFVSCFPFNRAVCISCKCFLQRMPILSLLHVNASSVCVCVRREYTANISIYEKDRWIKEIEFDRRWIFEIGNVRSKTQFSRWFLLINLVLRSTYISWMFTEKIIDFSFPLSMSVLCFRTS